jgi:hypothetical protein
VDKLLQIDELVPSPSWASREALNGASLGYLTFSGIN